MYFYELYPSDRLSDSLSVHLSVYIFKVYAFVWFEHILLFEKGIGHNFLKLRRPYPKTQIQIAVA